MTMAEGTKAEVAVAPKKFKSVLLVNLRYIVNYHNTRQPLGEALVEQGFGVFFAPHGSEETPLWDLLFEGGPEGKARYADLIREYEPSIEVLANSIQSRGQLQPVGIRPLNNLRDGHETYELVFGVRRCLAAAFLWASGISQEPLVQALVDTSPSRNEVTLLGLDENWHRKGLKPTEIANTFRRLLNANHWHVQELAAHAGVSQETVRKYLDILKLDSSEQAQIDSGKIARSLVRDVVRERKKNPEATVAEVARKKRARPAVRPIKEIMERMDDPSSSAVEKATLRWVLAIPNLGPDPDPEETDAEVARIRRENGE
jgi:ParB/RepB/Spo0J family partition protein